MISGRRLILQVLGDIMPEQPGGAWDTRFKRKPLKKWGSVGSEDPRGDMPKSHLPIPLQWKTLARRGHMPLAASPCPCHHQPFLPPLGVQVPQNVGGEEQQQEGEGSHCELGQAGAPNPSGAEAFPRCSAKAFPGPALASQMGKMGSSLRPHHARTGSDPRQVPTWGTSPTETSCMC